MEDIMINKTRLTLTALLSLTLIGCGSSDSNSAKEEATVEKEQEIEQKSIPLEVKQVKSKMKSEERKIIEKGLHGWHTGEVKFLNLEGGFYGIVTSSGKKLLPMNLPKEFAQNGAVIRVKGKEKNIMTIQQWGTPFEITDVELISAGKVIDNSM